jgi:hypothetical protein
MSFDIPAVDDDLGQLTHVMNARDHLSADTACSDKHSPFIRSYRLYGVLIISDSGEIREGLCKNRLELSVLSTLHIGIEPDNAARVVPRLQGAPELSYLLLK